MKRLLYFIAVIILFTACNTSNNIEIKGTIEDGKEKTISLSELQISGLQFIDSVKIKKDGGFKIKSSTDIPRFYQLSISKTNFLTLLIAPGEKVRLVASSKDLNKSKIEGSEGSLLVQNITNQLAETKKKLKSIVKSAEANELDQNKLNKLYSKIVNNQRDSSIAFIIRNLNSMASIVALYQKYDDQNFVLYKNRDIQYMKIVSEALLDKYPESEHVKTLVADKENLMKKYDQVVQNNKMNAIIEEVGTVSSIPEIYLPNTKGDSISLNATKGKYILINFWASWSEESLKRNLLYKNIYAKYHSKGFEIYQISLDTKEENWTKAIQFDQLPWINVIDLNGRLSYYAKIYNVKKLPTSFLINPDGEIIMTNPSKAQLESTLKYNLN
jgi:peroxiredoxin